MIVREFTKVDVETNTSTVLYETLEELLEFPNRVRHYLEHELGPVSAFLPAESTTYETVQSRSASI